MEKLAYIYRVKEGKLKDWLYAHDKMWQEFRDLLTKAGVKKMTVFNRDNYLFLYAETENLDKYFKIRNSSSIGKKWDEYMDTILVKPFDSKEPTAFAELKEFWSLKK